MVFYGVVFISVLVCDVHGILTPAELEQQMKNTIISPYITADDTLESFNDYHEKLDEAQQRLNSRREIITDRQTDFHTAQISF